MVGLYDVHAHILPQVDDGAGDLAETRKLLQIEYEDGVRTIFVTPHYRRGMFETSLEEIQKQYEQVRGVALEIANDLRIVLGCEYHAHSDMVEALDKGRRPLLGDSRCVLVEFSERWDFRSIREHCYALLTHGYHPVIAHAERYPALNKDLNRLRELVDMGAYIQMNAGSIIGAEGWGVRRFCKKAMKENLLHLVGSDAHNCKNRKPMMGQCAKYLEKQMGQEYMEQILIENPRCIIEE